jgi:DNA-binding NtrC family response regulator
MKKVINSKAILYVSEDTSGSSPVLAALKATGHKVVRTNSSTQAIALLFLMHSVVAVVLNREVQKQAPGDLAQTLRAIRPTVLIVLLGCDQSEDLPSTVDACVSIQQSIENIASEVRGLLTALPTS